MNLITKIRNIIFLYRTNKDIRLVKANHYQFYDRCLYFFRGKKNTIERNLLASIIKQLRVISPYKIQDYIKAKKLFDSITPIDISNIKKDTYVFKFSREEPVKGKRWCEYFINQSGNVGIYKVHKYSKEYNYWSLENYDSNWNHFTVINEESMRYFRFATKEEITDFKNRKKEFKKQQELIAKKYKEIEELRNNFK